MIIIGEENASQIALCLEAAPLFLLDVAEATQIVTHQIKAIQKFWTQVCDEAALTEVDRNLLWRRQFLNGFAFVDAPKAIAGLVH